MMKKKNKVLIVVTALFLVFVCAGLFYVMNLFGAMQPGNKSEYSVKRSETVSTQLSGKTIIYLGSSVTYGYASRGESFADYLQKQDGIIAVKEAVSGTTLVDDKDNSYVSRMKKIDKSIKADMFICQLSTNDATQDKPLGSVSESRNADDFDTHTIIGAMEYIIAYANETWHCPVTFYTGTKYDSENYQKMVDALSSLKDKWGIGIIDLWNNDEMNQVSENDYDEYMNDSIHPTRKGYKEWWTPVFRQYLLDYYEPSV